MNENYTEVIGKKWSQSRYYEIHEEEHLIGLFWNEDSVFKRMFDTLDTTHILELACGHGRHVPKYINIAESITLVDINKSNIDHCKKRFSDTNKINYIVNNGKDLCDVPCQSKTAIFSYDAMVHFELTDIIAYIQEFSRILARGEES